MLARAFNALHFGRHFAPAAPPRAPTLVVDLDETLLHRPLGALGAVLTYAAPWAAAGEAYAGAAACVAAVRARGAGVVGLTARWRGAAPGTERALAAAGVARLPVVFAGGLPHAGDGTRAAFKAGALRALRGRGWALAAGAGDRASDVAAYAAAGLPALALVHARGAPRGAPAQARLAALRDAERALRAAAARAGAPPPRVLFFTDDAAAAAAHAAAHAAARFGAGEAPPGGGGALFAPARAGASVWEQLDAFFAAGGLEWAHGEARAALAAGDSNIYV